MGVNAENASDLQLGRLYDATYNDAAETLDSKKSTVEEMVAAQRQIKALGKITFDDIVDSGKASGNEDVYFYRSLEDRAKSNRDRNSSVVPLKTIFSKFVDIFQNACWLIFVIESGRVIVSKKPDL